MGFVATFLKNFFFVLGGYVNYYNNDGTIKSETPSLIPRRILFGNPDVTQARIDTQGKYLAFLKPKDGVLNIWIQPLADALRGESTARPLTNDSGRGIRSYSWTNLPKILIYTQVKGLSFVFLLIQTHHQTEWAKIREKMEYDLAVFSVLEFTL